MQALQQLVNEEVDSMEEEVSNAWKMLEVLPSTNLFKRTEHLAPDHLQAGDSGLYDSLLIKRDQAYTIPGILEMVNMSGLHFLGFSEPDERLSTNYRWFVKDPVLLTLLDRMVYTEQLAVGEIIAGNKWQQNNKKGKFPNWSLLLKNRFRKNLNDVFFRFYCGLNNNQKLFLVSY